VRGMPGPRPRPMNRLARRLVLAGDFGSKLAQDGVCGVGAVSIPDFGQIEAPAAARQAIARFDANKPIDFPGQVG
jgi:hypothetical protein